MATPTPTEKVHDRRTFLIGSVGVVIAARELLLRPPRKPKTLTVNDSVGLRDGLAFPGVGVYSDIYSNIY